MRDLQTSAAASQPGFRRSDLDAAFRLLADEAFESGQEIGELIEEYRDLGRGTTGAKPADRNNPFVGEDHASSGRSLTTDVPLGGFRDPSGSEGGRRG
jgi:hypothetical protein